MIKSVETITCDMCGVTNTIGDTPDFYANGKRVFNITVIQKAAGSDGMALDQKDWHFEDLKLHLCKNCVKEVVVLESWSAQGFLKLQKIKKNEGKQ
jgi:protein-disulfide isomerase-like protein with CxxC motif